MALSALSSVSLFKISSNPTQFVLLYTLGNIVALFGTMFLWGPWSQIKRMFEAHRAGATIAYLGMLIATAVVALATGNFKGKGVVVLVMLFVQWIALLW